MSGSFRSTTPNNYTCNGWYGGPALSFPAALSVPTTETLNTLLARSNPSKPVIDVPVFLVELRDLPGMLLELRELPSFFRDRGRYLLDLLAKGNLSYKFGWKPFLSDLGSLLDFRKGVADRMSYLSKLYAQGGIKFKSQVYENRDDSDYVYAGTTTPLSSAVHCYTADRRYTRRWYSVSWVPDEDVLANIRHGSSRDSIRDKAFRSYFGLELSLATAWEALPWSWLIDWFSDVGAFLNTRRNSAGFIPGDCYTMTTTYRRREFQYRKNPSFTGTWVGEMSFTDGWSQRTEKTRTKGSVSLPTVTLPILTNDQLSILASIVWLRANGR